MQDNLLNQEEWEALKGNPLFKKFNKYLEYRVADLAVAWVSGAFIEDKTEELRAQTEAETLDYLFNLDYETISDFYIGTGRKKEKESGNVIT